MTTIISTKKYFITLFFVLALSGVIYGQFFYHPSNKDVNGNTNNTKTLPNSLQTGQASIEKVTVDGFSFVAASNIHPLLRPGSTGSTELIATKSGWSDQFAGVLRNIAHVYNGSDLLSLRSQGSPLYLDRLNLITKQELPAFVLGTLTETTNSDGSQVNDEVKDFSINTSAKTITYVIRRKILYTDPIGTVQKDSTAELWSFSYPDQQPQKITTLQSIKISKPTGDGPDEYDLPEQAFFQHQLFVIQYHSGLATYIPSSKKITTLQPVAWNSFVRYSSSPNGKYGALYVYRDHSTVQKSSFENHMYILNDAMTLQEVSRPVEDVVATMSWSPQEDMVVLFYNLQSMSKVNPSTLQAQILTPPLTTSEHQTTLYDALNSDVVLIGIENSSALLDEIPTLDPNGRTQMMLWNVKDNSEVEVGNYRTPLYFGQLK